MPTDQANSQSTSEKGELVPFPDVLCAASLGLVEAAQMNPAGHHRWLPDAIPGATGQGDSHSEFTKTAWAAITSRSLGQLVCLLDGEDRGRVQASLSTNQQPRASALPGGATRGFCALTRAALVAVRRSERTL
jgi:hypothetical protein